MRPNNNQRRGRGRAGRRPNIPARAQTYDSNGPGGRIRGNATQVYEKYVALARDAMAAGDRVLAEGLNQHAEHYFRIINDSTDPEPLRPPAPPKEEIEVSQDTAEQPAASGEAPAEAAQSEADSQQPPRRSRRRPRPPMGDGEAAAGEASQAKPTQAADEQAVRSEASEQPSAEDEGLRKMLSATGGASTGGASGGNASSRRRKSNGSGEAKEPEAPDEQPETASEPA